MRESPTSTPHSRRGKTRQRGERVDFYTLDVFTERRFAGNQLAVVPDAAGIPEERLLDIAREFNLSETVFVYRPADPSNAARVRIFTPARELPFAGHPTVGTAVLLATLRGTGGTAETTLVLEEGVGLVPVKVRMPLRAVPFAMFSVAKLPEGGPVAIPREALASALRVRVSDVVGAAVFSCGVPFLFVELGSRPALAAAGIAAGPWEGVCSAIEAVEGVFVFTADAERAGSAFRARMFAPGLSVPEDPGTGSAVAALAGHLLQRDQLTDGGHRWRVEQGFEMGRPCIIELECDVSGGKATAVRVGGHAVVVSRGELVG